MSVLITRFVLIASVGLVWLTRAEDTMDILSLVMGMGLGLALHEMSQVKTVA